MVETMNSFERGMNPAAMIIINQHSALFAIALYPFFTRTPMIALKMQRNNRISYIDILTLYRTNKKCRPVQIQRICRRHIKM